MARGDGYRKFSMKIGMALGAGGKATREAIAYLLRFLGVDVVSDTTWNNTDTINQPEDGVSAGGLKVVDTSTGTVKTVAASDALEITGSGASNTTGVHDSEVRTREAGRVFHAKIKVPTAGVNYVGYHSALALTTNIEGFRVNGTDLQAAVNGTFFDIGAVTVGQEYDLIVDANSSGFWGLIRGGTEYPTFILVFIGGSASTDLVGLIQETAAVSTDYSEVSIPEDLTVISPILHDTFARTSSDIAGSQPDTVNVAGDVWHNTNHTAAPVKSDGEAYIDDASITLSTYRIDCGEADHVVKAQVWSQDSSGSADNWILARVGDTDDNGFPLDTVAARVEHDTNITYLQERVAGVYTNRTAGYNPPENTQFDMILSCIGDETRLNVNSGAVTLDYSPLSDTTSTNVGIVPRGQGGFRKAVIRDFEVCKGSGYDIAGVP
jgi:hypothetical protein